MDLTILKNSFFTISDIYAERQRGENNVKFTMDHPRPTDAFILFTDSSAVCGQKDKIPLFVPHGALVYVPRGHTYTWENHAVDGKEHVATMLFEFTLRNSEVSRGNKNEIITHTPEDNFVNFGSNEVSVVDFRPKLYERLFSSLIDTFESKNASLISVYICAYNIFQSLIINKLSPTSGKNDTSIINSAINYLGRIGQDEKSIEEIADICLVSVSTLEKQFRRHIGMSPLEYRLDCKIAQAKSMINTHCMNISEIAEALNFCDSSYLCRIFKKKTGLTIKEFYKKAKPPMFEK